MAVLAEIGTELPAMGEDAAWPRLMTGPHPRAVGTYGPEVARFMLDRPHLHLRPLRALRWWQSLALHRAFEHDADGRLVWRTVVCSAPRQVGKSFLERGVLGWRLHQAQRFGQTQDIVHIANKLTAAIEVWRPAARWAIEEHGRESVRWANGEQRIEVPDGSRWLVQAANQGAGVAFALCMVLVDEAWSVPRTVVDAALVPTMAESEQPQLWLVSTAGDSSSDLMSSYRAHALADPDTPGDLLLLEWSAPPDPDLDLDDPAVWRSASPHWDDRRALAVAEARRNTGETEFRTQWLNQWVPNLSTPLFEPSYWANAGYDAPLPPGPVAFGLDVAADRSAAWIVATSGGVVEVVDARVGPPSWVADRLVELCERWHPTAIGLDGLGPVSTVAHQLYAAGAQAATRLVVMTGREMAAAAGIVFDDITEGRLRARFHTDLDLAVAHAGRRSFGQSWTFTRQVGEVSISPLIAVTAALWAADHAPQEVENSAIW